MKNGEAIQGTRPEMESMKVTYGMDCSLHNAAPRCVYIFQHPNYHGRMSKHTH
jgi:hypothetical protein